MWAPCNSKSRIKIEVVFNLSGIEQKTMKTNMTSGSAEVSLEFDLDTAYTFDEQQK